METIVDITKFTRDDFYLVDESNINENNLCLHDSQCVEFKDDKIIINTYLERNKGGMWREQPNGEWKFIEGQRQFVTSSIMTKRLFHYGLYELHCSVPTFTGAWPAVWFFNKQQVPPEIDMLEVMCKPHWNPFVQRKNQSGLYVGANYQNVVHTAKSFKQDMKDFHMSMEWTDAGLLFMYDNPRQTYFIEAHGLIPMNLLISMGIGTWNNFIPDYRKFEPFVIHRLTYTPYTLTV